MKCNVCGAPHNGGAFCSHCGSAVNIAPPPQNNDPFTQNQQNQFNNNNMGMPPMPHMYGGAGFTPPPVGNNFNNPQNNPEVISAQSRASSALVCGILSFFFVPLILGIIAIVNGASAVRVLKAHNMPSGNATTGMVLGVINVAFSAVAIILISTLWVIFGW